MAEAKVYNLNDYREQRRDAAEFGHDDEVYLHKGDPRLSPLEVARAAVAGSYEPVRSEADIQAEKDLVNEKVCRDTTAYIASIRRLQVSTKAA